MKRAVLACVGIFLLLYAADFLIFTLKVHRHGNAFGVVTVEHYYAVHEKNGKTEYIFQNPENQLCAEALFPHAGDSPCWYARRRKERKVDI
ncbi:MAG TPA: hypothetical protein VFA89_14140 [Terriglobales bacterium]|nr:hypothetical protein [Terriglobales bacterium]